MRKNVRILALTIALVFLLGSILPVGAADGTKTLKAIFRNLKIVVNGSTLISDKEPFIVDGTTYVPIRLVGEATGAVVDWDPAGKVVITTKASVDPAELEKKYQEGYNAGLKVGDLNGYVRGLQEGKEQVQKELDKEDEYDEGYDDGYDAGYDDGYEAGEDDYDDGNRSDWEDALPSNSSITRTYDLDEESSYYEDGFLEGYEEGFEEGYEEGYDSQEDYDDGYDDGWTDGYYDGYDQGEYDAERGYSYDDRAPSNSTIVKDYDLDEESESYEEGFLDGYEDGYEEGYEDGYDDHS